jgi:hypothetical protein
MTHVTSGAEIRASDHNNLITAYARKTITENLASSTTYQNDDALVVPVLANTTYDCEMWLLYNSGATPDFKARVTVPAGAVTPETTLFHNALWFRYTPTTGLGVASPGGDNLYWCKFALVVAGTPGNLQVQWAQNTSDASTTAVQLGSWLRATPVT